MSVIVARHVYPTSRGCEIAFYMDKAVIDKFNEAAINLTNKKPNCWVTVPRKSYVDDLMSCRVGIPDAISVSDLTSYFERKLDMKIETAKPA